MFRRVLAAAAMIGLVAVLSSVIYTIVAPEPASNIITPALAFDGKLELTTSTLSTVNEFIKKAIQDNELSDSIRIERSGDTNAYSITCSREELNLLMADLGEILERCNSNTLLVNTKTTGERTFEDVTNDRLITIVNDLMTPVKPNLTSGENEVEKPAVKEGTKKMVHLSIVVAGSE